MKTQRKSITQNDRLKRRWKQEKAAGRTPLRFADWKVLHVAPSYQKY
jgi:hypothetical protein